ncbi:patatin-like phospholipase family protein [Polynucleobacter sp. UK-Mo-2m-Kol15]|uniref:patatin-like phospholipase family protein n=1 Tax=Polynucleobacter sp. UK-Mo-2m-Kol15 TaxID=2576916 RepID=UPI001C0B814E|nr:patatin-like phospholipase family protein [Polynucleobacter sp. UK-Mo-2m-Kol15]MBU3575834.1 patatin-like phospholipase family protein [Polynucleobacter sp. UK-Mo-2m-Kol15]
MPILFRLTFIFLIFALVGCSSLQRKAAVPSQEMGQAQIAGLSSVRYMVASQSSIDQMAEDIQTGFKVRDEKTLNAPANYLSLSGGGDDGAYGAGLLIGWADRGDRPQFNLVTGISTGALIAPFAFMGREYDPALREVYTKYGPRDIFIERGLISGILSDGLSDTSPLFQLISKYIDQDFLKKVANEYTSKNRWLLIGTTNLDAGVPVVWNMGKIASIGTPEALELFRKIMLASASIPGAFSPVMFDFEVSGQSFHEMHVDGGAITQVFLYPSALSQKVKDLDLKLQKQRNAYIIRNARLDPEWRETQRGTLSIIQRAISSLIQTQGVGDLYRIYHTTQLDGVGFNLAYIGSDFKFPHKTEFDTAYMQALFEYGYKQGLSGKEWQKYPPGYKRGFDDAPSKAN